jgi:isocitrate dehydrogenase (NAD+)
MQRTGRKRVTIGHKSNVLAHRRYVPESRETLPPAWAGSRQPAIDAPGMELVVKPETFDCSAPNLISSRPGAGLGRLGSLQHRLHAMFEAVHGSAPDIAGRDIANPMSMILSAVMMLRYLGESAAADRIDQALAAVLVAGRTVTRDLGGSAGTGAMTAAIVGELKRRDLFQRK